MTLIGADDGVRLFCQIEGDGPPVVFAHEFGGDWRSWDAQAGALCDRFRCIRYAARGFLPSDVPLEVSRYGQARATCDLAQLVEALVPGPFHLVGCSMGSYTSLMYALSEPARLASLTLIGCSAGPETGAAQSRYRAELQHQHGLLERDRGDGAAAWLESDPAYRRLPQKVPAAWRAYRDRLRRQSVEGAQRTLTTLHWDRRSFQGLAPALRGLEVPTLLVHGEEDHPRVRATHADLSASLPRARVLAVPETGHLVQLEEAALFNDRLRAHIDRADGPPKA